MFGETVNLSSRSCAVFRCIASGVFASLRIVKVVQFDRCIAGGVLPVSVTVFQLTAEQRQTEDDGVPCQSLVHLWPGLHTRRHTGWIKPLRFAVPGDGRVHVRASTASCELRHAAGKDSQHS